MKRITKNPDDGIIFGVCEGLGNYFNIDPLFFRLIWMILICINSFFIIMYLIFALVIPEKE